MMEMVEGNKAKERKARKWAEREDNIIRAAEELIFAKGFANTTIDDIAARADVSKGAIYLHYRTKDEIYFSIASKALEIMRGMFQEAVESPETGLEKFRAIGYSFYEYTKRYPEYSDMLYNVNAPSPCHNSESEIRCQDLTVAIGTIMVSSIERGIMDGSIRSDVDPLAAALIISSSMQGLLKLILGEKEMMKERGLDEKFLVDYSIELYGRSLMGIPVTGCTPAPKKVRKGKKG
jgi:TetR/AcrR family transcriptional regulator